MEGKMDASQALATSEGILFTVRADSKVEQCLIAKDALHTLSLLKNIDPTDASALEIFQAFEGFILDEQKPASAGFSIFVNSEADVLGKNKT